MKVSFTVLSLLVLSFVHGCADECDDAECSACIGRVDTDEAFPFVQAWNGTALVNESEVAVQITLEPQGPVQKPEHARNATVQDYCDNRRQASIRWTIEVGASFTYQFEQYTLWNKADNGDGPKGEDWSLATSSVDSLTPGEDAWPSECTEETSLDTNVFLYAEPDRLHLSMEWRRGFSEECRLPLLDLQLGYEG